MFVIGNYSKMINFFHRHEQLKLKHSSDLQSTMAFDICANWLKKPLIELKPFRSPKHSPQANYSRIPQKSGLARIVNQLHRKSSKNSSMNS